MDDKVDSQPGHWKSHTYICLKLKWENKMWTTSNSLRSLWLQPVTLSCKKWRSEEVKKSSLVIESSMTWKQLELRFQQQGPKLSEMPWVFASHSSSSASWDGEQQSWENYCKEVFRLTNHSKMSSCDRDVIVALKPLLEQATSCNVQGVHVLTLQSLRILLSQVHTRKVRTSDSAFHQYSMGAVWHRIALRILWHKKCKHSCHALRPPKHHSGHSQ